jgi:3-oxoacyl-[acyl-carrier-protein] synthase II
MRYTEKRVVITGVGVITPNGRDKDEYWTSLLNGISGIDHITTFDTVDLTSKIGGAINDFDPASYGIDFKSAKRMAKFSQYAVACSRMAIKDAGIEITQDNCQDIGIILGVICNAMDIIHSESWVLHTKGAKRLNPLAIATALPSSGAAAVSIELGIKGRTSSISTGCSSALNAIGYAYELVKYGKINMMLAGGAEAPVNGAVFASFCASRTLSQRNEDPRKASRPFDKSRDGYILSEGGGMVVVESMESAMKRNAQIYAEIIGYGSNADAHSIIFVEESGDQLARAIAMAINDSGINPSEVDYVNAHAASSHLGDLRETRAIKKVFSNAKDLCISSVKSMTGHPLGAAGGWQVIATVLAGKKGYIPPTINYDEPDGECDLNYVPNESIRKKINVALVNSFGMGGNNASLLLRMKP